MAQANTEIDFYPRKIYHCRCFRGLLEKVYKEQCLRSINEIIYELEEEQHIKFRCKMFMHKKLKKNYTIVCPIHFGHFLLEDNCGCQMTDGSYFQFGYECLNKIFCYNCLNLALELMKSYSRFKLFNE